MSHSCKIKYPLLECSIWTHNSWHFSEFVKNGLGGSDIIGNLNISVYTGLIVHNTVQVITSKQSLQLYAVFIGKINRIYTQMYTFLRELFLNFSV
jgi:hypothetical protein